MKEQESQIKNAYKRYGEIKLGDTRLAKRLEKTMETLHKDPSLSICGASEDRYEAKAIYRMLKNPKFTISPILEASKMNTIERIIESGEKLILLPQDTSELDYTNLKACDGLGVHGTNENSRGIIFHSSIAVSPSGMTYGLVSQELWVRPPEEHGKSNDRRNRPIEEKESRKWLDTMDKSMNGFPDDIKTVTVCDREGDIYELFRKAQSEDKSYLIRLVQNRLTTEETKLIDFAKGLNSDGICVVQVPRDTRNNRPAREAQLEIKYSKITIKAPRNSGYGAKDSITAWVVAAEEIGAPDGVEPIAWYLLTNIPVTSFDEACEKVRWYVQRWKIERFHFVLKNVCKVNKLQERNAERLIKLIVIYSIIAMTIMFLMYLSRTSPDIPCDVIFTEEEWKLLYIVSTNSTSFPP